MILANELRAGTRLPPERDFAAELGVSRSSLRDALRVLELRSLIERKRGRGTVVLGVANTQYANAIASGLDIDQSNLLNVMEVRACIEPPVAARAAERATAINIAQLTQLVSEMTPTLPTHDFVQLDRLFHRAIAQYTHNPLLLRLLDRVSEITEVSRTDTLYSRSRQRSSITEHRAILDAIANRDPVAAFDAASKHVQSIQARIVAASGETHGSGRPGSPAKQDS
jgi:GntR family transcriptional regulator, transcriptional repressor for pyruvate dehydrogenase complex